MSSKLTTVGISVAMAFATLAAAPYAGATPSSKNSPVAAGSPNSSTLTSADRATLQRQGQLDALADQITGTSGTERQHTGGYAGIVVHPETGELALYWKGVVPQKVKDVHTSAAAKGLKVTITQASHSAQELERARDTLEKGARGKDATVEPAAAWNSVAVKPNGSGLFVTYNSSTQHAMSARTTTHTIPAQRITSVSAVDFATRAQALAGVPVQAAAAPEGEKTTTRDTDSSPFWGGALLATPSGHICSTAFAGVHVGRAVVLTASHCGTSGTFKTGAGIAEGTAGDYSFDYDTTVVNLNGAGAISSTTGPGTTRTDSTSRSQAGASIRSVTTSAPRELCPASTVALR